MIKIISHEKVTPRVLIKKITEETTTKKSKIVIQDDDDQLPRAEVVMVPDNLRRVLCVGDKVYYMKTMRGMGKVKHNDEEHWLIDIGNIVGIYEINYTPRLDPPYSYQEVASKGNIYASEYGLDMFDDLFKNKRVINDNKEFVLTCKPDSFKKIKGILNAKRANVIGFFEKTAEAISKTDKEVVSFSRNGFTVHVIKDASTDFDLFWPWKESIMDKECTIIES